MRPLRVLTATLTTALSIACVGAGTSYAAADPIADAKALAGMGVLGANNWDCKPSKQHPEPIVLVHGTTAEPALNWATLSPGLAVRGYCVFALSYGKIPPNPIPGLAAMEKSAAQLATFVKGVLAATKAPKVSLVGHSQGGLMPRYYLRFLGGAVVVDDFVALAPPNHGSTAANAAPGGAAGPVWAQFKPNSEFLKNLNAGREVEPGVDYTTVNTKFDMSVVPYTSGNLKGSARQITNITLQDKCPNDRSGHAELAFDLAVHQLILNALQRQGPTDPGFKPVC